VTSAGAKPGSGGCTTATAATHYAACKAVYNFLISQAKATGTYTSSPIWTVIDGPWKLASFNTTGNVSFVPNPKYSGSPKPTIAKFTEVPYTSDSAEYTALRTGTLDIGYIPPADLPAKTSPSAVLPPSNPLGASYTLAPNYDWGFAYYQINWKNPTMGPVFKQLYARQALEYVDDQIGMSKATYRGYAYPNTGPAPSEPANNPWLSSVQKENGGDGPYPFSTSKAGRLRIHSARPNARAYSLVSFVRLTRPNEAPSMKILNVIGVNPLKTLRVGPRGLPLETSGCRQSARAASCGKGGPLRALSGGG
jgi:peptide/nickel transport system substrate-binding protein